MHKLKINICDTCYTFKGCIILNEYQLCTNPKCACYYDQSVLKNASEPSIKLANNLFKIINGNLLETVHKQNKLK